MGENGLPQEVSRYHSRNNFRRVEQFIVFRNNTEQRKMVKPNTKKDIQEIDEHLGTRVRGIIWKQWKKVSRREKALLQLGVKPDIDHNLANTSKGYQLVAKTDWLKFAINIERLRKRGLIFLSDQYQKVHIEI